MTAMILRGDARALPLPNASVDLIVTSPPYYGQRSYRDDGEHYEGQIGDERSPKTYISNLVECTREWMRVLKPSGSLFVNLGDKYVSDNRGSGSDPKRGAAKYAPAGDAGFVGREMARQKSLMGLPWRYALACIDDLSLILRAEVIWYKTNCQPESVKDRVRRAHEQWFHLTMEPRYFAELDDIRTKSVRIDAPRKMGTRNKTPRHLAATDNTGWKDHEVFGHPLGRVPGSVWEVAVEPLNVPDELGIDHYAAFPSEWPRRIITGWCPAGGVVADPFGGTGTTALIADTLGRIGISVDRSADYCRLAAWRTTDSGQRAKVLGLPKPPTELDGQGDLLAELDGAA